MKNRVTQFNGDHVNNFLRGCDLWINFSCKLRRMQFKKFWEDHEEKILRNTRLVETKMISPFSQTFMVAQALIHNKSTFPFESQLPRSCFAYIRKLLRKSKKLSNCLVRSIKRKWSHAKTFRKQVKLYYSALSNEIDAVGLSVKADSKRRFNKTDSSQCTSSDIIRGVNAKPNKNALTTGYQGKLKNLKQKKIKQSSFEKLSNFTNASTVNNCKVSKSADETMNEPIEVKASAHSSWAGAMVKALIETNTPFPAGKIVPIVCLNFMVKCRRSSVSNRKRWLAAIKRKWADIHFREEVKEKYSAFQQANSVSKKGLNNDSNNALENDNDKQMKLYCTCQKPDDGKMYVYCETCLNWLHPRCVFDQNDLAITLTSDQWDKCSCACRGKKINHGSKQVMYHNVIPKNEIINDTSLSELGLDDLDETISSIDTRSNLDGNIDNGKSEIKLCDDRKDIGLSLKHDVAYSDKATNTIPCASTAISYQFKPEKTFQAEKTNSSITNCIVSSASIDDNAPGLTFETIQDLGDYKKSVVAKEKRRFSNVNLKELIVPLSTCEWVKMTKSRSKNHFVTSAYSEIVLPKLRELYSGCVPCVRNNYLRKPSEVLKLRKSDEKYYEGYISIYCRHANCCHCDVFGKIEFYSFANKVEGVARFSGKRSHFRRCVKSRPLVGKNRSKIVQKMENERPYSIYRNLQNSLTEEERVLWCPYVRTITSGVTKFEVARENF